MGGVGAALTGYDTGVRIRWVKMMTCKRCRQPMKELRGIHHGHRKWQCRHCGKITMQRLTRRPN
jgi:transposase-like protein